MALAVRFALTPLYAHLPNGLLDEGFWKHWMEQIQSGGILNIFRTTDTNYVGYHWVLWGLAGIYSVIGGPYTQTTPSLHILVKMPSIAFDVILIIVVYHATRAVLREQHRDRSPSLLLPPSPGRRDDASSPLPLLAAAVIAFQPAVLYDSAVWAQTDSAITAAMLGAIVLAYAARPVRSGVSYALGLAVKPHPVIVGPLLLLALLRNGWLRAALMAGAAAVTVTAIILGPWIVHGDLGRIIDIYRTLFSEDHQRLSELAWNGWWIADQAGDPRASTAMFGAAPFVTYRLAGLALSGAAASLALAYAAMHPGLRYALVAAAYQAFAFWALPIGSHERYLYPFLGLLLPVAVIDRRWLWLYVPVSAMFFLNLFIVAPPVPSWMDRWVYGEVGVITAGVQMALFLAFTVVLANGVGRRLNVRGHSSRNAPAAGA